MDPLTIVLVGCGAQKLPRPAPAGELYTGSLFRAARRFAETCDDWRIISAAHGLLHPDTEIAPYDHKLRAKDVDLWGHRVADEILTSFQHCGSIELVILAGATYAHALRHGLRDWWRDGGPWRGQIVNVSDPLAGMGLGKRLSWLKAAAS